MNCTCLCGCFPRTVDNEFFQVLKGRLAERLRDGSFDAVIIETTGLADPAPVAQTFFIDKDVQALCRGCFA